MLNLSNVRTSPCFVLAVLIALVLGLRTADAQTAPDGNAHPQTQDVSQSEAERENPFGEHSRHVSDLATVEQKVAFAKAVDLEPIRALALFHNGRVKVLDTLARETVKKVTGRAWYREDAPRTDGPSGTLLPTDEKPYAYDPLFTMLDMVIDPMYYIEKPAIGIGYLPLRQQILELEFPGDEKESLRRAWLRTGRISPAMLERRMNRVLEKHDSEEAYRQAAARADQSLRIFALGRTNLQMIAPTSRDLPWSHLSTLSPEHPARAAALDLGKAWRARDAAGVSAAAARLAEELPKINSGVYPEGRRELEIAYNRSNAFEWGFWAYGVSFLLLVLAFGTERKSLAWAGVAVLAAALAMHSFGFITRCIIAERFAIQNQFESMTGLSLFAVLVGLAIMLGTKRWLYGAAAAGTGFIVLMAATQTEIPGKFIEREAAILNTSVLLKYHVTTVLASYGLIAIGFILSCFYLGVHYAGKLRAGAVAGGGTMASEPSQRRTLTDLDKAQMIVLQLAFWTLGVGILLGAWWADHSWGRWWAFDPKETWALITWIIYLIVIHVRLTGLKDKGFTTAWLSIVGFIIMLWTYFGVNLLLPGLHAYA